MPLLDKLEEIRKKPESYRKKVMFSVLFLVMSGVVALWVLTLDLSLDGGTAPTVSGENNYSPISVIADDIKSAKEVLGGSISAIKEIVSQIKEESIK